MNIKELIKHRIEELGQEQRDDVAKGIAKEEWKWLPAASHLADELHLDFLDINQSFPLER